MAQSGYTPIQHYRTTTAGAAPAAGNLTAGELGINVNDADMALYAKNATGNVKRLINNPAGLKYPTDDGTSGQAITTNGSGVMTFSSVQAPITGAATTIDTENLTASRALVSDGSGKVAVSSATSTELGYVSGVTSAIQTQLNSKLSAQSVGVNGFYKADPTTVAFTKTGAGTANVKAGTIVGFADGTQVTYTTATAITMPTLTAGTDYAIWADKDGSIQATTNFTSPPETGSRKIGGFHYAPGGNATNTSGGDSTPAINAYSFWDLKFRPTCPDPRGMALVADGFWSDIYLLGVDHLTNGTSKYNVTIADGSSPAKIPTKFGGNGSTAYGSMTWWETNEVLRSHGKRPPAYDEFAALAYGTTEASSGGTDPGSTILRQAYTSKWGVMLSTGNMWVWGANFGGGAAAASWTANTNGRGSTYQMENAAIFGGAWVVGAYSGSRCSLWDSSPTYSGYGVGGRGVSDHLTLE